MLHSVGVCHPLQVTRLGKFVNLARRKTTDRSLSKRLKNLVKRWQKLLQSGPSNGLVPSTDSSQCAPTQPPPASSLTGPDGLMWIATPISQAPSPVVTPLQTPVVQRSTTPCPASVSVQSVVTASPSHPSVPTSIPPSVPTSIPPAPLSVPPAPLLGAKNDAIFNRRQKLQMLSQVNKRPPAISSFSGVSTNIITHPVKSEATEVDQDRGTTSIITGTTPVIRGASAAIKCATSLAVTQPDDTCTEVKELLISIPLTSVMKAFSKHPPTGANGSISVPTCSPSSPIEQVIQAVAPPSHHDHTPNVVTASFVEHALSLVVSIDTSRLAPCAAREVSTTRGPQENTGVPLGCVPGIDGHIGQDGSWYNWTKHMPSMDGTTVTVLPYVYVDGWEMADQ